MQKLPRSRRDALKRLGVTKDLFSRCMERITIDDSDDGTATVGVELIVTGLPGVVEAWCEDYGSLQDKKIGVVYRFLCDLTREEVVGLKAMEWS